MIETRSECVGCPPEKGCLGDSCRYSHVTRCYCDSCKEEFEPQELYVVDGEHMCAECILSGYRTLEKEMEAFYE